MSKRIKVIIIIVEIIMLLGLSGYRVFEYLNNNNEEIKENENNESDGKDNISTEEQTNDKIKILVYQINIRKDTNEISEDIGDVLLDEVYDVLEIVDTTNYTWYKINKNGIIGYVANQKGENWVEYSENGQFEFVNEYKCVSEDCQIHDSTDSVALVYEDNKYFIYDYKAKEKKYLNIDDNYSPYPKSLVEYDGKLYGILCSSGGFGGGLYYSLGQNKMLHGRSNILNEYESASVDVEIDLPFVIVIKHWNIEPKGNMPVGGPAFSYYDYHEIEIIDVKTEETIQLIEGAAYFREEKIVEQQYYVSPYNGKIYDENYKLIENVKFNPYKGIGCWEVTHWAHSSCSQFNYLINNNNTLTVINDNNYIIYDKNMKEIYKSDTYEQIYLIKDHVITTKDGKMYIFDLNGKIIKEFELKEKDSEITGVSYDKNNVETFKIAIGDNYYYYIPSTGESGIKELVINGME